MYYRNYLNIISLRLENETRKFIQVLYGPRQVGKTTLMLQFKDRTKKKVVFASADAVEAMDYHWVSQVWESARINLKNQDSVILILDEVQKITNWSEIIKKEWDADTRNNLNIKVVLLGSSRLLLMQGLTESLAGRFETLYIPHWSFSEMNEAFGITPKEYLWYGGYPGSASLFNDEERWKSYVRDALIETSISKDILMLTRINKPALLRKLFEIGCQYSGQILSYTKILGQLHDAGNTTTLAHYLSLLDSSGLLSGLEKFSKAKLKTRSSSPKFQVQNMGLMSALSSQDFNQVNQDPSQWGRWVESCIGAHLLNSTYTSPLKLYYWREGNYEVDFVLEYKSRLIAIEVKTSGKEDEKAKTRFSKQYKPEKFLLVGNEGIDWQKFIKIDPLTLFSKVTS